MRYKIIAEQVVSDIQTNRLSQGQRLPSLRQLALQHKVSMTTALNSYRRLEEDGWLIAKPQSGFFVSSPKIELKVPTQPQFVSQAALIDNSSSLSNEKYAEHTSGPLGISQISPNLVPVLALEKSIKRGMQNHGVDIHRYCAEQGLPSLRTELSHHFGQSGFHFDAHDLVITAGCIDAVRLSLEVCTQSGDGVAISSPCFNGLLELLAHMGRKVIEIPCNKEGVDLAQLEQHIKNGEVQACLFSSSHMNPQGICLSLAQKQTLATFASTYQIPVIEDDIYLELGFHKAMPLPIKTWDKDGYVLWCGSVSKTLSAGYRLGWCLPGKYKTQMLKHLRIDHLGLSSVVQAGLAHYMKTGQYRKHIKLVRSSLLNNVCSYQKLLKECLPENAAISQPDGGMVLWIQVPNLDAYQLYKDAQKINIDIRAGQYFTTRRLYKDCFRINTGWALHERFDETRSVEQALRELLALIPNAG